MRVGIPREMKVAENRVACTPAGARALVSAGHEVLVEAGAGSGCGLDDAAYTQSGARTVPSAGDAWSADLVLKVKEPTPAEFGYLRPGLTLFTFLHLAADKPLAMRLIETRTTAIAYETIMVNGRLPLLEPMSEIAGRMGALVGSNLLSKPAGGKGVLPGGVPGVLPGKVLIIGGGSAGINAARVAHGLGAEVTILELNIDRMRAIDSSMHGAVHTLYSSEQALLDMLPTTDLLIAAALVPGAKAPVVVTRDMIPRMEAGSVVVDIAIDQGGCIETSKATTHTDPTFVVDGVVHYCVANMPGAYPRTATLALTNATLPYALRLAAAGEGRPRRDDPDLQGGVNTIRGAITSEPVAVALDLPYTPLEEALA